MIRAPDTVGLQIWTLVSGLPNKKRIKRQLRMFQAYIDESADGDQVFVLAGYIAPSEAWALFSDKWQEMLDMDPPWSHFKMNERAQSPVGIERSSWFYRIIENHVTAAVSCFIDTAGLVKVVRETKWPSYIKDTDKLGNPYYFAFKAIIDKLAQNQKEMGITEPIDFIFDERSEKKRVLGAWDYFKFSSSPNIRNLLGDIPSFKDDMKVLPLQAADLYAWWVRKWEKGGITDGVVNQKFAWEPKKDILRAEIRFPEEELRKEFTRMLTPSALSKAARIARLDDPGRYRRED